MCLTSFHPPFLLIRFLEHAWLLAHHTLVWVSEHVSMFHSRRCPQVWICCPGSVHGQGGLLTKHCAPSTAGTACVHCWLSWQGVAGEAPRGAEARAVPQVSWAVLPFLSTIC